MVENYHAKEQGIIDIPQLQANFHFNIIENLGIVANNFQNQHILYGQLYQDVVTLINGRRSVDDIVKKLPQHTAVAVKTAMVKLRSLGLVVSGEHKNGHAGYWGAMGTTPLFAEQNILTKKIHIILANPKLQFALKIFAGQLKQLGFKITNQSKKADFIFIITDDYFQQNIPELIKNCQGIPTSLMGVELTQSLIGPVFHNRPDKFCFECLSVRLFANNEVFSFIKNSPNKKSIQQQKPYNHQMVHVICGLTINELVRFLLYGNHAYLDEHVISFDGLKLESRQNYVQKRPQCNQCGDPHHYESLRVNTPFTLEHHHERVFTSGGMRAVSPQDTYIKYKHLISPISGVVKDLIKSPFVEQNDPWYHCYVAGQNLALNSANIAGVKNSLRSLSSGKGRSDAQARVSCIMESIERYSTVYTGNEIAITKAMNEFKTGEYIDPRSFLLYSENQYKNRDEINRAKNKFLFVPEPFNPDIPVQWSPVWSMSEQKYKYFPTCMLYFSYQFKPPYQHHFAGGDSNGLASGTTKEDAMLQGFYELIERDAFAQWWYNRLPARPVDFESFNDNFLNQARAYYAKYKRDIWMLDLTSDFGIPVYMACSIRTDGRKDLIFAPGAHENPLIACLRAVCELNQYLSAVREIGITMDTPLVDDPELVHWWNTADLENQSHFKPVGNIITAKDYNYKPRASDAEDIQYLKGLVEQKGMELLVLNCTRPDINVPVVRTMVPGLRHFWARFAPGRLYDVPVAMGKLPKQLTEEQLNPIPVFI